MVSNKLIYSKVIITFFLLSIFSGHVVFSQSKRITPPRAAIDISSIKGKEIIIELDLTKESTLQEIAKYFDISESVLTKYNKHIFKSKKAITGSIVNLHIPVNKVLPKPFVGKDKVVSPYCQLYYTVQKGENLFNIAIKSLEKDIKLIQQLNNLTTTELKVGQRLIIGYLQVYPIEAKDEKSLKPLKEKQAIVKTKEDNALLQDKANHKKETSVKGKNKNNETLNDHKNNKVAILVNKDVAKEKQTANEKSKITSILDNNKTKLAPKDGLVAEEKKAISEPNKIITKSVIAMWDKNGSESKSLFVLHNEAKVGSTIQVYFPMLKSKVNAKVLGKIPAGTYNDDIALFLSPAVARELGILDTKANLVVSYID